MLPFGNLMSQNAAPSERGQTMRTSQGFTAAVITVLGINSSPTLLCLVPWSSALFSVYPYIPKILHLEKKKWLWCQEANDVPNESVFWLKRQNCESLTWLTEIWTLISFRFFEVRTLTLILRKKSEFWLNLELQRFLTLSQNSERNQEFRD